jgi:hypothetical protein
MNICQEEHMHKGAKIFGAAATAISLLLGPANLVFAQPVNFPSLGISSGLILQQNKWNPGYSVGLQCEVGEMIDYVFLVPYLNYWNAEKTESGAGLTRTLSLSDINLGAELIAYINSKPQGFFSGAGIGYHIIMADRLAPQYFTTLPMVEEKTETKLSFAALLGYQLKVSSFSYALKLKYFLINGGYNTFQTALIFSYNL